jgi:hypothetical protein
MQTFFPHHNIYESAHVLDSKRLNKQILEAYQILKVLSGASPTGGWRNHPAVLMWKGSEYSLRSYAAIMIEEAKRRGIKTDKNEFNIQELENQYSGNWGTDMPEWFNDQTKMMRITTTHKARLFDKDPLHYAHFGYAKHSIYNKPCCSACQYYWVTHESRVQ